jgi:spermidine synthase
VLAAVGIAIRIALPRVLAWRGVWFTWRTRFGPALVFDSADADGTTVRLLNVRGTYQSVCYVDDDLLWVPVCAYHRTWGKALRQTFGPADQGEKRRALVMGGGGYSFPKWLVAYRQDFSCEAVEIDPAITRIARERFFVDQLCAEFGTDESGRLVLANDDAWRYLQADTDGYDLIVNDVFSGNRPLGPMGSDEGARVVHEHLRPGGMYIGNVRTALEGRGGRVLARSQEAFEREFAHVQVIPERPEEPRKRGNNTLIAWDSSNE